MTERVVETRSETERHDDVPAQGPEPVGRACGLFGLAVSTLAILLASSIVVIGLVAAAFGAAVAVLGLHGALDRLQSLNPSNPRDPDFVTRLNIVVGLAVYVVVGLVVLAAARFRGGTEGWRDLVGWRPWHPLRRARLFWGLLVVTLVYSFAADRLVTAIHPQAKDWTPRPTGTLWDLLFFVLAAVLAPVAEELLFRGWIYTSLRRTLGVVVAIGLSAALFALAHWERTHLYALAIFPVGLALGLVREKTGSIAASITFHALYNGFATALLLVQ